MVNSFAWLSTDWNFSCTSEISVWLHYSMIALIDILEQGIKYAIRNSTAEEIEPYKLMIMRRHSH